ncbi:hypothetical protein ARMSODRAFT_1026616 [Armillaria solidipes]|uniref:Uncharacterized protein n=1 Tax=Armillaria solidipes TaxID=1076256 RepID=A0A2H3AZT7_9AGAR|nr:hypothetical protein ARMSODRAFT_1026616 [Armillaria solidipes]
MVQDIEPIHGQDIIVQHERKLSQDIDTSWRKLMLMVPSLQITGLQDIFPSTSGQKRERSPTIDTDVDVILKKAKVD